MNKTDLIAAAAERTGMTKKDTERALTALLDTVTDSLLHGEKVQINGFGVFETRERAARIGRNPKTGEAMPVAATKVPTFKPGKALKDCIGE